jgi:hypothetical protein
MAVAEDLDSATDSQWASSSPGRNVLVSWTPAAWLGLG